MYKSILVLLVLLFQINQGISQCSTLTLKTQEDVNTINTELCRIITGNVLINESTPGEIQNLDSLFRIQSIEGDLVITGMNNLSNLVGLDSLQEIGGKFTVDYSPGIVNLEGLNMLKKVGKKIRIAYNDNMTSLQGMPELDSIQYAIEFFEMPPLNGFAGLENIKELEDNLIIFNSAFTNVDGFQNLTKVADINISGCTQLINIDGFAGLIEAESISLNNVGLTEVDGFNSLEKVDGDFNFLANEFLTEITIGETLCSIERTLDIRSNPLLESINGFNGLKEIGGTLNIRGNEILNKVDGFKELHEIGASFSAVVNGDIEQFTGFEKVDSIGGDFNISAEGNLGLASFDSLEYIGGSFNFALTLETQEGFKNLRYVGEEFDLRGGSTLNIPSFENLKYVGSNFRLNTWTEMESFSAFHHLDTIGGWLRIKDLRKCTEYDAFSSLKYIGNEFSISDCKVLTYIDELESLTYVGEDINLGFASATFLWDVEYIPEFPVLEEVAGSISIVECSTATTLDGFPVLRKVGGDIYLRKINELTSFQAFNLVDSIGGDLDIDFGKKIEVMNMLQNVKHIGGDIILQANIGIDGLLLNALENLEIVEGRFRASNADLDFSQTFKKLKAVGSDFNISYNDVITDFDFLENLRFIGGDILIQGNNQLESILGLSSVRPESIGSTNADNSLPSIQISTNPQLDVCNILPVCGFLQLNLGELSIFNNLEGCNTVEELMCEELGVVGQVYFDYNRSGTKDLDDPGMSVALKVKPNDSRIYPTTDGLFFIQPEANMESTIEIDDTDEWLVTSTPEIITINEDLLQNLNPPNIGIFLADTIHRSELVIVSDPFICNRESTMDLKMLNTGWFEESGALQLYFPTNIDSMVFNPTPSFIDSNYVSWSFESLRTFESIEAAVDFIVPPVENLGDTLQFSLKPIFYIDGDTISQDSFLYQEIVLCSFDPNDKMVSPIGTGPEHFIVGDERLVYTIRFQNLGNFPAEDVIVADTLSEFLDVGSFRLLAHSHPVEVSSQANEFLFKFNNIYLPDSMSNPEGSNGYVVFGINPKENLEMLTRIENTAHIYFDSNPAIVTNTAFNTIRILSNIAEVKPISFNIYPNPSNDIIFVHSETLDPISLLLYDQMGKLVNKVQGRSISVQEIHSGLYFLKVQQGGKEEVFSVVIN